MHTGNAGECLTLAASVGRGFKVGARAANGQAGRQVSQTYLLKANALMAQDDLERESGLLSGVIEATIEHFQ